MTADTKNNPTNIIEDELSAIIEMMQLRVIRDGMGPRNADRVVERLGKIRVAAGQLTIAKKDKL